MKRLRIQARDWEKIPAKYIQKGQSSKIYTELLRLNKKTRKLTEKWIKDFNNNLIKEDIKITSKHMKRYSRSHTIGKMETKTTKSETLTTTNAGEDTEQQELSFTAGGNANSTATQEGSYQKQLLKELNILLPHDPEITLFVTHPK